MLYLIKEYVPLKYRTQIFEKYKGKLQYYKFKEKI